MLGELRKHGLETLDLEGQPFDPNLADAVAHEAGDGGEVVVAEVLRSGYRWKDRTLRPAMVRTVDRPATGDGRRRRRRRDLTGPPWLRSASGSSRTTTPPSASPTRPRPRRSPRRIASWRASCIPTRTPATPRPRSGSRRCRPRTTCWATRPSARSTTRSAGSARSAACGPGGGSRRVPLRRGRHGRRRSRRPLRPDVRPPAVPVAAVPRPGVGPRRGADVNAELTLDFADAVRGIRPRCTSPPTRSARRATARAPSRARRPSCARTAVAAAWSTTTRACSRSRRRAAAAAGSAPWSSTRARRAAAAASRSAAREVKARIPAGVADGQTIRLKGRGARAKRRPARRPARHIHVAPHPRFARNGNDLTIRVPVPFRWRRWAARWPCRRSTARTSPCG